MDSRVSDLAWNWGAVRRSRHNRISAFVLAVRHFAVGMSPNFLGSMSHGNWVHYFPLNDVTACCIPQVSERMVSCTVNAHFNWVCEWLFDYALVRGIGGLVDARLQGAFLVKGLINGLQELRSYA